MATPGGYRSSLTSLLAFALAVVTVTLLWGYAHAYSHGTLTVSVTDVADSEAGRASRPLELAFRDAAGHALARAARDTVAGGVYLSWPARYDCHSFELRAAFSSAARKAWDQCFAGQSRWIQSWIQRVAAVDARVGDCAISSVPARPERFRDAWWLWWSPNPHVGGPPYTNYSFNLRLDSRSCTPVNATQDTST